MFQELQSEYYEGVNHPEVDISGYCCDRCNTQPLTEYEYINNIRNIYNSNDKLRYCNECTNWIIINKFKCIYCNNSWSCRSEREIEPKCKNCNGLVVRLI